MKIKTIVSILILGMGAADFAFAGGTLQPLSNTEQNLSAVKSKMDSMDKIAENVKGGLDAMDVKLKDAEKRIKEAEAAKNHKPNYWMPIIGGALLGIGLAVWLKRKK